MVYEFWHYGANAPVSIWGELIVAAVRRSGYPPEMGSPLAVQKITIRADALRGLSPERRSAVLLLGHMMNEANWLRKLLVQAVLGISDSPEGKAQFGLTVILATILASKLHEGWLRMTSEEVGPILRDLQLPPELVQFRKDLKKVIEEGVLATIRNKFAFHYPHTLDFVKLTGVDDADTVIFCTESAYNGDLFADVSALAAIDSLITHDENADWQVALKSVWEAVTNASGRYCKFVSEVLAFALTSWLADGFYSENIVIANAPKLDESPLVFFAHPPDDLEKLAAERSKKNPR